MEAEGSLPPPPPPPPATVKREPLPSQEELVKSADGPEIAPLVPIARRGTGNIGRRENIYVNFFKIKFSPPEEPLIQYQVDFTRDGVPVPVKKGGNLEPRMVFKMLLEQHPEVTAGKTFAFDGERGLFSLGPLPIATPSQEFPVDVDGRSGRGRGGGDEDGRRVRPRGTPLTVTLTRTGMEVALGTIMQHFNGNGVGTGAGVESAMRGLDVAMRYFASERFISFKDSIFLPRDHPRAPGTLNLNNGVEAWQGYKAALRLVNGGIALNLDVVTAAMVKPMDVIEYMREVLNLRGPPPAQLGDAQHNMLRRALKGLKVETKRQPGQRTEKKKFQDLPRTPASAAMFPLRRGDETVQMSVADYYTNIRHQPLDFPGLPCIDVGRKNRPTWWPLEVCQIVDAQMYLRKLTTNQVAILGRNRLQPKDRMRQVNEAVDITEMDKDPLVKSWGLEVEKTMMKVPARILPAPQLAFAGGIQNPANGQWNIVNQRLFTGSGVAKWAIASPYDISENDLLGIARQLATVCESKGVSLPGPPFAVSVHGPDNPPRNVADEVVADLIGKMGPFGPELVVWVLRQRKTDRYYASIKTQCETHIGVPSQCIVPDGQLNQGRNKADQYLANVALKINIKLGKVNWVIKDLDHSPVDKENPFRLMLQEQPTMVLGMDVGHGPAGSQAPSVAAVVGSLDNKAARYSVEVRTQPRRQETIAGLWEPDNPDNSIMCKLLSAFGIQNDVAPMRLIIYRDGVSESQFPAIGGTEIHNIREACKYMAKKRNLGDGMWMPRITYIVAQKRNNTRFFLDNYDQLRPDAKPMHQNPKPGTVVDEDICHPFFFDFYLNAHQGILGSSRPVHFHVLQDDSDFTADQIQWLTHSLCYSYMRCTRAVSTVAPVFYAHLAAAHCRNYLDQDDGSDSGSVSDAGRAQRLQAPLVQLKQIMPQLQNSMFFC